MAASPPGIDEAANFVTEQGPSPDVGIVLGSGLGAFAESLEQAVTIAYDRIPGMPMARVSGHAGRLLLGTLAGKRLACLQGRVHLYEGHSPERVVFGVRLLARLGAGCVLITNAAGGIAVGMSPGDVMLIEDHLNLTGHNPLAGMRDDDGSPFCDMTRAYDEKLGEAAQKAADEVGVQLWRGVYAGLLGPSYETPAEIRMLETLGASAVGMSTVLETIALRQLGVRVAGLSLISNLAAGLSQGPLSHQEVKAIAGKSESRVGALLGRWLSHL
jgi:purine-nucleoside phosphorylase